MKKSDIKAEIMKALRGKEMDIWDLFWTIHWVYPDLLVLGRFKKALSELVESGEVIEENGLYKLNSNQPK